MSEQYKQYLNTLHGGNFVETECGSESRYEDERLHIVVTVASDAVVPTVTPTPNPVTKPRILSDENLLIAVGLIVIIVIIGVVVGISYTLA